MKYHHVLALLVALAALVGCPAPPVFSQDANLHLSQTSLAPGSIPQMDWKKARDGAYTADEYFLITLTIQGEGENGGPGGGYLYQGMRPIPLNGWIIILVPDRVRYFERGMTVYFWASYLQSVKVEIVNQNTGKLWKVLAPVMRAKLWGIRAVR